MRTGANERARQHYLVQVPAARGRVIPDIDSIREDFPALCEPTTAIMGKSTSAPTLHENENTSRWWMFDTTYPVARMRSMISRILRRLALWVGLDRPIPRGSDGVDDEVATSPVDGVVAKEAVDETEDALLLWGLGNIGHLGIRPGSFYRSRTRIELEKGKCGGVMDMTRRVFQESRPPVQSSVSCSAKQVH